MYQFFLYNTQWESFAPKLRALRLPVKESMGSNEMENLLRDDEIGRPLLI